MPFHTNCPDPSPDVGAKRAQIFSQRREAAGGLEIQGESPRFFGEAHVVQERKSNPPGQRRGLAPELRAAPRSCSVFFRPLYSRW